MTWSTKWTMSPQTTKSVNPFGTDWTFCGHRQCDCPCHWPLAPIEYNPSRVRRRAVTANAWCTSPKRDNARWLKMTCRRDGSSVLALVHMTGMGHCSVDEIVSAYHDKGLKSCGHMRPPPIPSSIDTHPRRVDRIRFSDSVVVLCCGNRLSTKRWVVEEWKNGVHHENGTLVAATMSALSR